VSVWVAGASHRTAPIEVRERFHVSDRERPGFLAGVLEDDRVRECTILSTCNRSELYLRLAADDGAGEIVARAFGEHGGLPAERVRSHLYTRRGRDAVAHLFRVTAGLDSMVVGEPQIQGQVASAYRAAREVEADALGPVLHRLFQTALSAGGHVRTETAVAEGAASVPSAAVRLARKVFGELEGRRAVVVGAGEMGRLTLAALLDRGVGDAVVASRTLERAEETAERTGARAVAYDEVWELLDRADVLLTSTSAPHPVVTVERMRELRRDAREPVVVIDIAVPRDVEPDVGDLQDVFLYNIDDLQRMVEATERNRDRERTTAEGLLDDRVGEFWEWYRAREAVPLIRRIRDRAEAVREREMSEAIDEIDGLSKEQRSRIHRASRLVLKKILHAPTVGLRELALEDEEGRLLEIAARLFDVDPDPRREPDPGAEGAAPETEDLRDPEDGDDTDTEREDSTMMDTGSGR
jgi:glutamyl-tRNA reductase